MDITTRGVLLDVPKYRGEPFVTIEKPVHGEELEAVAKAQGVAMEPGDALVLYGGREKFSAANPDWRMESLRSPTPGFDADLPCLHPRSRRRGGGLGHAGRRSEPVRRALGGPRCDLRLWYRARRQCTRRATGNGVRGRGAL